MKTTIEKHTVVYIDTEGQTKTYVRYGGSWEKAAREARTTVKGYSRLVRIDSKPVPVQPRHPRGV